MRRGRGRVVYVALGGITLLFVGLAIVLLRVPAHASVQVVTVTTTNDNGPIACVGSTCQTLRDALSLAATFDSDSSNPVEIDLPSGTITLTQGVLSVGSATDLFTRIKGATGNAGDSVVQEQVTATAGVFSTSSTAGLTTAFQDFTIRGGNAAGSGGGVLVGGGTGALATFTNCVLDANATALQGGAIAVASPASLTVATSTFTSNSAHSLGGAVYFSSSGTLQVSGSSFVTNTSGVAPFEGDGGAVYATGEASASITVSTFTGNQANGTGAPRGGAVFNDSGPMSISLSRFTANTASLGSNVLWEMNGGSVTANDNWWGTNAGPGTTVAHGLGGTSHFGGAPVDMVTNWLQLRNIASPAALAPGAQSTLTADLLGVTGTSTTPLAPGSLGGLAPFPVAGTVFGNPVHGSLSNAGTQFVGGVATATFTASPTLLGPATADATADSETATATMTVTSGTTTTVSTAPSPSVFGQGVVVSATVSPGVGGTTPPAPTGSVNFFVDNQAGIPVSLTGASATTTVGNLSVGTHSVTATYTGDADFDPSVSTPATQVVNQANASVAVASSPNPSTFGQAVAITATVTAAAPGAGTPSGTVQFKDGSSNLGAPVALAGG
ncbi:MAG TPA: Ig-like domain-containing protein, partial [Actinomycetota bacterium]